MWIISQPIRRWRVGMVNLRDLRLTFGSFTCTIMITLVTVMSLNDRRGTNSNAPNELGNVLRSLAGHTFVTVLLNHIRRRVIIHRNVTGRLPNHFGQNLPGTRTGLQRWGAVI